MLEASVEAQRIEDRVGPAVREALTLQIREAGAIIDPPRVKGWYAPYRDGQATEGVSRHGDLVYGEHARHRLDMYVPSAPISGTTNEPRPAVIFLHGGGFIRGDKRDRANVGWRLARAGYAAVLPNYRLGPDSMWPAGAEDVARVRAWVQAHADEFGLDPSRVFVAGESAGAAHVAASTLMTRFAPQGVAAPAGAIFVSGVYHAELELRARAQFGVATPDPRNEAYFGSDFSRYHAMSTVEQIDAAPFPLLITYAELDPVQMQVQAGELFARLVTRHGFAPEIKVIAAHNHLSQVEAINTVDDVLAGEMLRFLDARSATTSTFRTVSAG